MCRRSPYFILLPNKTNLVNTTWFFTITEYTADGLGTQIVSFFVLSNSPDSSLPFWKKSKDDFRAEQVVDSVHPVQKDPKSESIIWEAG
jgi:hypothetical protein